MTTLSMPLTGAALAFSARAGLVQTGRVNADRWVFLVVIAIALVLAVGLAVAWWSVCQAQGGYPALDMPSFNAGGTWKAYCAK